MSLQHQKWLTLVQEKMKHKNWSKSDLAQVCGVSPAMITRLLKEGYGSDSFKLLVSKNLAFANLGKNSKKISVIPSQLVVTALASQQIQVINQNSNNFQ